jgi:rhamnose transport system permease protein
MSPDKREAGDQAPAGGSRAANVGSRLIRRKRSPLRSFAGFLLTWESLLFIIFAGIVVANSLLSQYFLDPANLFDATLNFTEKAIIAMPMIFVIILGDIDISVASIIALSSLFMGMAGAAGASTPLLVAIGLGVGLLAGLLNGFIITRFNIPAIAVTLGTMSLYRGISNAVLGDQAYTKYPADFGFMGQGYAIANLVPFQLLVFLAIAAIAAVLRNSTVAGRYSLAIGNSKTAARFSGVPVERVRMAAFAATGFCSGIASVLLTSRIGSTRPNIASGWELDIITTVVLGGVAITGGKGNIPGVIIAIFLIGFMKFGMGVVNVPGKVMNIVTGALLIVAILLPKAVDAMKRRAVSRQGA